MCIPLRPGLAVWLVVLALVFSAPTSAFAHERRTIGGGKYDVVVGWDVEPAYQDLKNGASIRISQAGSNPSVPVEGADKTLKVQIRQGAATREFPLRAVFGQPGYYVADIIPNRAGDYEWTFVGSIGDAQINDTFDTADGKFNSVQSAAALEFPLAAHDPAQTASTASTAGSDAQGARLLGLGGLGVALVALLGVAGLWLGRPRVAAADRRPTPGHV